MKKKIPNRPKTSEIEAVIKNKSQKITVQDQMASLVNSTKYLKRVNINVSQTLPKKQEEGMLWNSVYVASITHIPETNNDTIRKKKL